MEKNNFIAGEYRTFNYKKEYEYKSFIPNKINKPFIWKDKKINLLLEEASRLLGNLNECSLLIPDINTFIRMHVIKEATISTRIEGTITEIDEAVLLERDVLPEKRDDWNEVHNYIDATDYAIKRLGKLPLSMRLLKETHKIILKGVRGSKKQPGEVRTSQNWIGGRDVINAHFVPPPKEELPKLLSDLEMFWHNKNLYLPRVIKVALTHYQFETIHPFSDGNGRIGRLLITLQFIDYKIIDKPILYISDYFERNKGDYYHNLDIVRQTNNIDKWLIFFLNGIIEIASRSKSIFEEIIKLRMRYEDIIRTLGRRTLLGQRLLLYLFAHPVVDIRMISEELNVAFNTADSLLKKLEESKMITTFKYQKSNKRLYVLMEYFDLFRK
ncbi:MAG: Fic/DOC family N-terminal domain-containing protein [Actinomycetota bacterium]